MKIFAFALLAFFASTSLAFAHAPTAGIDPITGPLEYASFPQTRDVTGIISHNPLSSLRNLTLWVNGTTSTVVAEPFPESIATSSAFSLPWNITAPGTYTLMVTAKHGTTGSTGTSSEQAIVVTEKVVVPPPPTPTPTDETECPAAPAIAAKYLKELGIKAGSRNHKNVVSQVAKHMGPQKMFDGIGACTSAYGSTIENFVDNKLD